jgi:hypothetical protein
MSVILLLDCYNHKITKNLSTRQLNILKGDNIEQHQTAKYDIQVEKLKTLGLSSQ